MPFRSRTVLILTLAAGRSIVPVPGGALVAAAARGARPAPALARLIVARGRLGGLGTLAVPAALRREYSGGLAG